MMSVNSGHVKNNEISAILDVKIIQDGVPDITCTSMMMKTLFKHRVAHSAEAGIQRGPAQHYRFTSIEILIILNILNN